MVGDEPVFKTLSANVAVAMANLDPLSYTLECHGVRTSIQAHLITAMGQIAYLLKMTQAISYMEVTSNRAIEVGLHHDLAHIAAITHQTTTVARWLIVMAMVRTPAATMGQGMITTRK